MKKQEFIDFAKSKGLKVNEAPKYTYVIIEENENEVRRYRLSKTAVRKEIKIKGTANAVGLWTKYLKDLEISPEAKITKIKK